MRDYPITADELRSFLAYDPETGVFTRTRITSPNSRAKVGDVAGSLNHDGYCRIQLGGRAGRPINAHRLAWLYMMGEWPKGEVDHIDGNPSNNRWVNLRLADRSSNVANSRKRSDNKSGMKGVYRASDGDRYRAEITVRGRRIFLGSFISAERAQATYARACRRYFGEFARP